MVKFQLELTDMVNGPISLNIKIPKTMGNFESHNMTLEEYYKSYEKQYRDSTVQNERQWWSKVRGFWKALIGLVYEQ